MDNTYNLELLFSDAAGSSKKITIRNPREGVTAEVAQATVAAIVAAEIFQGKNGDAYAVGEGARYVRRTVEDIYGAE